eukprot:13745087-Alexandrium_andersonii.AAC.1
MCIRDRATTTACEVSLNSDTGDDDYSWSRVVMAAMLIIFLLGVLAGCIGHALCCGKPAITAHPTMPTAPTLSQ